MFKALHLSGLVSSSVNYSLLTAVLDLYSRCISSVRSELPSPSARCVPHQTLPAPPSESNFSRSHLPLSVTSPLWSHDTSFTSSSFHFYISLLLIKCLPFCKFWGYSGMPNCLALALWHVFGYHLSHSIVILCLDLLLLLINHYFENKSHNLFICFPIYLV